MRQNIASDLGVPIDRISVKATTTEELGALGRGEGLACQAIVLLAHGDNGHEHGRDGH
jgi:2-C-methyl-D-erythritol 2,4-cyclodiphosphate synthase